MGCSVRVVSHRRADRARAKAKISANFVVESIVFHRVRS
jgi:hypothetical protein